MHTAYPPRVLPSASQPPRPSRGAARHALGARILEVSRASMASVATAALLAGAVMGGCGSDTDLGSQNRAPELDLIKPDGTAFKPGALYIELTANDPDPGQDPEDITIDALISLSGATGGGATSAVRCPTNRPNTSGLFTCTSLDTYDTGTYVLRVTATDVGGKVSPPVTVTVPIVNDVPTCDFVTPSAAVENFDEEVASLLILTCNDPDGETSRMEVCVDSDVNGRLGCVKPTSSGQATLQIRFTQPGIHVVTATATDEDGGQGQDSFTAQVRACEDQDGDGFSVCESISSPPDCDDDDETAYPGQSELCNGKDSNCDGLPDNISDLDQDGYYCDDCDNSDITVNPEGQEACDGKDNDCDGSSDENFDVDGDGFFSACQPAGQGLDCDDNDPVANPGATEICDGRDTNCNGIPDDKDQDKDGFVDTFCTGFTGENGGDCDDRNTFYNPGVQEICDGTDEDCDGRIDNDTECFDDDGDGYCEANCTDGGPDGDCDDTFRYSYPGAVERFDHRDNNCDGEVEGRQVDIDRAWLFLDGPVSQSYLGEQIDGGHDLSGDGIDDIIIGARGYDTSGSGADRGGAFVIHGRQDWQVGAPLSVTALPLSYAYTESKAGAQAGTAVASLGDMNGDGVGDFAVGAPYADLVKFGVTLTDAGSAYLFLGKSSGWGNTALSSATTRVDGTFNGVNMGAALDGGDINGDGLAELMIGAPYPGESATDTGWIFIFTGRFEGYPTVGGFSSLFKGIGDPGQLLGNSVTYLGLHDGDGLGDFAVGGAGNSSEHGVVVRLPGSTSYQSGDESQVNSTRTGVWTGNSTSDRVGANISSEVDINGDGYNDLLIGRFLMDPTTESMAFVALGGGSLGVLEGDAEVVSDIRILPQEDDACPCNVVGIGDMNGDGIGDFAVSAPFARVNGISEAGRVYLFYGRGPGDAPWPNTLDAFAEADGIFYGTQEGHRVGYRLGRAGDLNGDGFDDLAIGSPLYSPLGAGGAPVSLGGRVFIQFGAPSP